VPTGAGVTPRAVGIALMLVVVLAPVSFFVEQLVQVAWGFSEMVPPIAALGMAFLLTAINQVGANRSWWRGLSRQEILVIYVVLAIGGPLVSRGVMLWFLACSLGQQYYAHIMPQWQPAFFRFIPAWFFPGDWSAIEGFFQGDSSVPWPSWWTPLTAWGAFFVALFVAIFCMFLLVQRQWITHERLSFPIAQVPLEMVRSGEDGAGRLPASSMFWIGFVVVCLLHVQERLPAIFPSMPSIQLWEYRLIAAGNTGPLVGLGDLWLVLYPWCIALAYLIPKELSFSVWFFWIIRVVCTVAAIAAGATPRRPEAWGDSSFPAPYYQAGGTVIALGLLALWASRKQIAHALRSAVDGNRDAEDALPYRWVLLALLLSVGYMVVFCYSAGARLIVALLLIGLILAFHLVWGRLRAENGMSFIGVPFAVDDIMLRPLGTGLYRPAELITIYATRWSYSPGWGESCEVITGASLDSLKLSDSARIHQKPLVLVVVGSFVFALALGIFVELSFVYHYGFFHILPQEGWLESNTRSSGAELYDAVTNPSKRDLAGIAALIVGMTLTFGMAQMRLLFWWWPLHPVGYLVANVWGAQWWWMPLFIGWLLKSVTIRYGGLRLYQRMIPVAIGIIVGDRASEMLGALTMWLVQSMK
jgi:hypothetical protein